MRNLRLALFVVLVAGAGFATGLLNRPGGWYAALDKPWFNPPNWVFAPVWAIVYLLVAIAGWRTWERDRNSRAMMLWWAQMALNFLWPPIFFTAHRPGIALAVILMLLVGILAFIARQWSADRISAALFIPYAAWVGFASVLNFEIARLN
jgi:tryptophan-rich sensory protein